MMSAIMAQMMRRCLRRLSGLGRRYLLLIETSITQSLYCTLSTQGVVVALRQPNRAAINSRLKWFMDNIKEPLNNRVFVLRDFTYRVR